MLGILGGETPVIAAMARTNSKEEGESWPIAKRIYRFMYNVRVKTESLYEGMYEIGQQVVEQENPAYLVVAVDPVNFEKPYAEKIEGVSTVHKATPPGLDGKARLAHGYPAITATVEHQSAGNDLRTGFIQTDDFISQNREIEQALRPLAGCILNTRYVLEIPPDDQKCLSRWANWSRSLFSAQPSGALWKCTMIAYNAETEPLQALVDSALSSHIQGRIYLAGRNTRYHQIRLVQIRIPGKARELWVLVADDQTIHRQLVLITNVPLLAVHIVQQVYEDWRLRTHIEHGYRFDQEQGLDVEDMRVRTVDRMRRLFALVLLAAQIVFVISDQWPPLAVRWLRLLGGKLGLSSDRDGPYWLLRGIASVIITAMTLSFISIHPFPFQDFTYG
jgi:hypothetical protein